MVSRGRQPMWPWGEDFLTKTKKDDWYFLFHIFHLHHIGIRAEICHYQQECWSQKVFPGSIILIWHVQKKVKRQVWYDFKAFTPFLTWQISQIRHFMRKVLALKSIVAKILDQSHVWLPKPFGGMKLITFWFQVRRSSSKRKDKENGGSEKNGGHVSGYC